jgi:hypothetical protein
MTQRSTIFLFFMMTIYIYIYSQTRVWTHSFKWANDSVQDKGIERDIECIGFEGFN